MLQFSKWLNKAQAEKSAAEAKLVEAVAKSEHFTVEEAHKAFSAEELRRARAQQDVEAVLRKVEDHFQQHKGDMALQAKTLEPRIAMESSVILAIDQRIDALEATIKSRHETLMAQLSAVANKTEAAAAHSELVEKITSLEAHVKEQMARVHLFGIESPTK